MIKHLLNQEDGKIKIFLYLFSFPSSLLIQYPFLFLNCNMDLRGRDFVLFKSALVVWELE